MSVWSAPITAGGGTKPTVTVKPRVTPTWPCPRRSTPGSRRCPTRRCRQVGAELGHDRGTGASVSSGATAATTSGNELVIGAYVDSGFGDNLTGASGYNVRSSISNVGDMEILTEDQISPTAGATPNASVGTGANTVWDMTTFTLKPGVSGPPTAPGRPDRRDRDAGRRQRHLTWTAPANGGSPITSYTMTPYVGTTAQAATRDRLAAGHQRHDHGADQRDRLHVHRHRDQRVGTGPASAPSDASPRGSSPGPVVAAAELPMMAIHAILIANGKFIFWTAGSTRADRGLGPGTQTFTTPDAPDSVFCSGGPSCPTAACWSSAATAALTTGHIGIVDTNIFDPSTNTWTRVANMHSPAGTRPDRAGQRPNTSRSAATPPTPTTGRTRRRTTTPATNTWTLLSKISTSQVHEEEYPFSYLIPNGNMFTIGPSEDKSYELNVGATRPGPRSAGQRHRQRIIGHVPAGPDPLQRRRRRRRSTAHGRSARGRDQPQRRPTRSGSRSRRWRTRAIYHTLTMLANGRCWRSAARRPATRAVELPPAYCRPRSGIRRRRPGPLAAPIAAARNYHSTAVLMPTARCWSAGGGHSTGSTTRPGHRADLLARVSVQRARGRRSPRPRPSATYGATISVTTPTQPRSSAVNLVSLGADTHQIDMDQHFVPLTFTPARQPQRPGARLGGTRASRQLHAVHPELQRRAPRSPRSSTLNAARDRARPRRPGSPRTAGNGSGDGHLDRAEQRQQPDHQLHGHALRRPRRADADRGQRHTRRRPARRSRGLTNGTTYTFTVTATNAVGTGQRRGRRTRSPHRGTGTRPMSKRPPSIRASRAAFGGAGVGRHDRKPDDRRDRHVGPQRGDRQERDRLGRRHGTPRSSTTRPRIGPR